MKIIILVLLIGILLNGCIQKDKDGDSSSSDSRCYLKPEKGSCEAIISKAYFNQETRECESFTWGGCGGVVPFETINECKKVCEKDNVYIECPKEKGEFCIQVYDPVCGEDGKTYSNSCVACNSVNKYKKGEC